MKVAVVIPARLESSRFPRKLLANLGGKPVIQWVYDGLKDSDVIDSLIIATDNSELKEKAESFGAQVILTRSDHLSGTDRCAEVASKLDDHDIIINVQGDEPFINPTPIEKMINVFIKDRNVDIATLYGHFDDGEDISDPNVVKLVTNKDHQALYFSRSVIPSGGNNSMCKKHIGVYGFWKDVLIKLSQLEPTSLELSERLEQLRWLENGYNIYGIETDFSSISIDTPEDLKAAEAHMHALNKA